MKTSFAPGSKVVTDYIEKAGLWPYLEALRFHLVGYGCTTCIGNSGPLPEAIGKAIKDNNLVAVSVLSGNRNFEGRINPLCRANYLASPPLVVAYALAGRMDFDIVNEPLGNDKNGKPVYLRDIWPTPQEVETTMRASVTSEMFRKEYADVFTGDAAAGAALPIPEGDLYAWDDKSTYIKNPPYFEGMPLKPGAAHRSARPARAGGARRQHHHRSHFARRLDSAADSPAGKYLIAHGVKPKDFNSYGARRGNHEVMMRGTFANIRLRNQLAPGTEGGWTIHQPSGEKMTIYDAAMKYRDGRRAAGRDRRQGIRLGLVARLGGQGNDAARRARGDRGKLRAHSPQQSGRHGRAAAGISARRDCEIARADGPRDIRYRGPGAAISSRGRKCVSACATRTAKKETFSRWRASTRRSRSPTTSTAASCSTSCARWSGRLLTVLIISVFGMAIGAISPALRRYRRMAAAMLAFGAAILVTVAVTDLIAHDPRAGLAAIRANRRFDRIITGCELPVLVLVLISLKWLDKLYWVGWGIHIGLTVWLAAVIVWLEFFWHW